MIDEINERFMLSFDRKLGKKWSRRNRDPVFGAQYPVAPVGSSEEKPKLRSLSGDLKAPAGRYDRSFHVQERSPVRVVEGKWKELKSICQQRCVSWWRLVCRHPSCSGVVPSRAGPRGRVLGRHGSCSFSVLKESEIPTISAMIAASNRNQTSIPTLQQCYRPFEKCVHPNLSPLMMLGVDMLDAAYIPPRIRRLRNPKPPRSTTAIVS